MIIAENPLFKYQIEARQGKQTKTPGEIRRNKKARLKKAYNLTIEEHEAMYKQQQGKCAICGKEEKLAIDHNHQTGKVRQLLCNKCNFYVGRVEKDGWVEYIQKVQDYVKKHK